MGPKFLTIDTDEGYAAVTSPSTSDTFPGTEDTITSRRNDMFGILSKLTLSQDPGFAPLHDASTTPKLSKFVYQSIHDDTAEVSRSNQSDLVDRTRPSQVNVANDSTPAMPSHPISRTSDVLVRSDDRDAAPQDSPEATVASVSQTLPPLFRTNTFSNSGSTPNLNDDAAGPSNQHRGAGETVPSTAASAPRPDCTSKHFRVRKIIGRESIDGDTYYIVSWRSSWVPSDLIMTSEDGQERYIKIDDRNWRIAGTIKRRVKKGIPKELVRWVDDTMEPVRRLRRALSAIEEFERKPLLNRRVVSFDEALIDQTKISPQSEEDFQKAQVYIAEKWPWIEPRNEIDLTPAFRQITLELSQRRDDDGATRKTYQRLINQPQLRRLCWGEEYLLAGRFYECTPPKRNALLLQVVAQGVGDGCCDRCVSDIAPFKECVRDTAEDNPWLNGACANCGTAEANSTCCHHRVGTAHLERGRSKGLTSERLREFIDPTRSIELLKRLEYEDDDDSDTYSGDSYAESDTSSFWEPDGSDDGRHTSDDDDDGGRHGDSTINNFWTPEAHSGDQPTSPRLHSATSSGDGSGGLFVSPSQSISPFRVRRDLHMRDHSSSESAPDFLNPSMTQARVLAAVPIMSRNAARDMEGPFYPDRSSVTMAAVSPASGLAHNIANQNTVRNDTSGSSQMRDDGDTYDHVDSPFVQDLMTQDDLVEDTASPDDITTSAGRLAAVQSVETFGRTHPIHARANKAAFSNEPQLSLPGPRGRKRAASQPSEHEPATLRSSTGSSRSSRGAFNHSEEDVKDPHLEKSSANANAESSSTETKIDRGSTHKGCRANWPCLHPDNFAPDDGTLIPVYRNTIDASYEFSIGEVKYILSRSTCHWASAFTKVWDGWWEYKGTPVDGDITKAQFLLADWAEHLLNAAKECCPTEPNKRDVIVID